MKIVDVWVIVTMDDTIVRVSRMSDGRLAAWPVSSPTYEVRQTKKPGKYWYYGAKTVGHETPRNVLQLFERGELVWPEPSAGGGA